MGDPAGALACFRDSRDEWSRLDNAYQIADQDNSIARALLGLNRLEEARLAALGALRGWQSTDDLGGVAVSLHSLAAIRLAADDSVRAGEALSAARGLTEAHSLEFVLNELEFVEGLAPHVPLVEGPFDLEALFAA